jgi:hypothetical protein
MQLVSAQYVVPSDEAAIDRGRRQDADSEKGDRAFFVRKVKRGTTNGNRALQLIAPILNTPKSMPRKKPLRRNRPDQ